MAITDATKGLTVDQVEREIALTEEDGRKRLRHLRALLRCLKDEAAGQRMMFQEGVPETPPPPE